MNNKFWTEEWDELYPDKDFTRQVYSFSAEEIRALDVFSSLILMASTFASIANKTAETANGMSLQFVNENTVKRLGLKLTKDAGINYDPTVGKLVVAMPKVICKACSNAKAEYKYKDRELCKDCVEVEQTKDKKPVESKKK